MQLCTLHLSSASMMCVAGQTTPKAFGTFTWIMVLVYTRTIWIKFSFDWTFSLGIWVGRVEWMVVDWCWPKEVMRSYSNCCAFTGRLIRFADDGSVLWAVFFGYLFYLDRKPLKAVSTLCSILLMPMNNIVFFSDLYQNSFPSHGQINQISPGTSSLLYTSIRQCQGHSFLISVTGI